MNIRKDAKPFIAGFLFSFIFAGTVTYAESVSKMINIVYRDIKIKVDGIEKTPSNQPFIFNDTTFVPLRFVSESLGKTVSWNDDTNTISIGENISELKSQGQNDTEVLKSSDSKYQVSILSGWEESSNVVKMPLAKIVAANLGKNLLLSVIDESKKNFSDTITLDEYYDVVIKYSFNGVQNPKFGVPNKININGYSAIQFELEAEAEKVKLTYLYTLIETPNTFYRVISWTSQDNYEKGKDELMMITASFKEN